MILNLKNLQLILNNMRRKEPNKALEINKQIKALHEKFPLLESVSIQYHGSGDSFEEFWDIATVPDGIDVTEEDMRDLLWHAIDNSDADFNNDGSSGTITIDFTNKKMDIDNYYKVVEEVPSGIKTFK